MERQDFAVSFVLDKKPGTYRSHFRWILARDRRYEAMKEKFDQERALITIRTLQEEIKTLKKENRRLTIIADNWFRRLKQTGEMFDKRMAFITEREKEIEAIKGNPDILSELVEARLKLGNIDAKKRATKKGTPPKLF